MPEFLETISINVFKRKIILLTINNRNKFPCAYVYYLRSKIFCSSTHLARVYIIFKCTLPHCPSKWAITSRFHFFNPSIYKHTRIPEMQQCAFNVWSIANCARSRFGSNLIDFVIKTNTILSTQIQCIQFAWKS